MNGAVVLLSGGMDSVTALYHTAETADAKKSAAITFDYGAKHNAKEIAFAKHHAKALGWRHEIVDITFMDRLFTSNLLQSGGEIPDGHYEEESMKQTVVPFRNGILISIAAGFAESIEASSLVIAAHDGDHTIYPDCRETFLNPMAQAVKAGTYAKIEVQRPFVGMDKTDIASRGQELGLDFAQTWSCYKGATLHCGTCGTCTERKEAFELSGVPDPTVYAS